MIDGLEMSVEELVDGILFHRRRRRRQRRRRLDAASFLLDMGDPTEIVSLSVSFSAVWSQCNGA